MVKIEDEERTKMKMKRENLCSKKMDRVNVFGYYVVLALCVG